MKRHLRAAPLTLTLVLGATATAVLIATPTLGAAATPPCSPTAAGNASVGNADAGNVAAGKVTAGNVAAGIAAIGSAAIGSTGAQNPAGTFDMPDYPKLRRNTEAVSALGIPAVQARATTGYATCAARVGVADVRTGRAIPADGAFRIASTSKSFTATVVLQLVGEGRLGLDDPVERWLPGIVAGRPITIRQLLQHTSGLQDALPTWNSKAEYLQVRHQRFSTKDLVANGVALPQLFDPGEGWAYSNTGYMIAELLIERITGQPWDREFERRIFRPLGMRHTYWPGTSPDIRLPHAKQYQRFDGELVDVTSQIPSYPAGGIVSTTRDLDTFFRALLGGRLLRPAELTAMKTTRPVSSEIEEIWPDGRYGLGLVSRPLPGGDRYWGHDGGDSGSIVILGVTEDGRRGAVVSMNFALDGSKPELLSQQRAADKVVTDALRPPR
ncbi:serine hydrolase domain-containing protein [Embleya sp. NPDC127516]|uniref:serine hydrolase domain-containing protein n=1 Tax=Embleya sp. NPDC127516 TaxID=3363990 RepID=UPI00380070D7